MELKDFVYSYISIHFQSLKYFFSYKKYENKIIYKKIVHSVTDNETLHNKTKIIDNQRKER